jgi:hypothetical protein
MNRFLRLFPEANSRMSYVGSVSDELPSSSSRVSAAWSSFKPRFVRRRLVTLMELTIGASAGCLVLNAHAQTSSPPPAPNANPVEIVEPGQSGVDGTGQNGEGGIWTSI